MCVPQTIPQKWVWPFALKMLESHRPDDLWARVWFCRSKYFSLARSQNWLWGPFNVLL